MFHLRIMLRQMLTTEGISNIKEWEETLLRLALRIARDLTFTAYPNRAGADMDVRRYVKIKKIPGGAPKDSEYVDGAVITKNVAHKQMSRSQRNPRIMFVAFPLEFQRVEGQYMHFGQIVRQEKEYLGNLASRIAALRPHIVLVDTSVSRLALEAFVKYNIAVARTVKKSAMQFAARMTQGDIFSSIDKLATEPRLGHCAQFRIQTFDHPLIPGRRKTYMRFEGCHRDLGCTIILRGGDNDSLKRVKKVTLFLTFIVRNLKLETHLWKDSVITLPQLTTDASQALPFDLLDEEQHHPESPTTSRHAGSSPSGSLFTDTHTTGNTDEIQSAALSKRIHESLQPYLKTFISVSATLRFLPPYPILKMKELDVKLKIAKRAWEDEIVRQEQKIEPLRSSHAQDATITCAEDIIAQIDALPTPGILGTPISDGLQSPRIDESGADDYFDHKLTMSASSTSLKSMISSLASMSPGKAATLEEIELKKDSDIAAQVQLEHVKWQHEEHRKIWEWYLRKNRDDFVVDKYQCIRMLEFTLPISELGHHRACFPPCMRHIDFYGENDCTLGQFVEEAVRDTLMHFLDPKAVCSGKGCEQSLARHCRVYVHNQNRLIVYVEQWDGQIKARMSSIPPEMITTWSACRVCGSATPFIPVSEEMQRYSFGKFLELHFYPADVQLVQGAGCAHNIYQHHIRYFAYRGMTVMFQTDPITLYEIIFPPSRIHVHSETLLALKNADCERLLKRNAQWYSALVDDLKLINIDAATGDEKADTRLTAEINVLIERAESERADMVRLIHQVYSESLPSDTLALNRVRAERQDRIVAWQADFDKLPKPKALEKESRMATAFGSVRAMWPSRYGIPGVLEQLQNHSTQMSEVDGRPLMMRRVTGNSFISNASASDLSDSEPSKASTVAADPSKSSASRPPKSPSATEDGHEKPILGSGSGSDSTIAASRVDAGEPTDVSALPSQVSNCSVSL
jgi:1-phosphatidylinositol-3-phosphate 5-kinase